MGTPLGPKYIPFTYMDPLGFEIPAMSPGGPTRRAFDSQYTLETST